VAIYDNRKNIIFFIPTIYRYKVSKINQKKKSEMNPIFNY